MSHRHDEDRLDRILSRAVDLGKVEFDRKAWLDKLASRPPDSDGSRSDHTGLQPRRKIWRTIMESRITRYSVAATLLVAASVVLFGPFGGRHGVVLAEVAQKLSETRTVMHKERRLAWRPGEDLPFFEGEVRKYFSSDIGFLEEQYDPNGAILHRIYFFTEQQQAILVLPPSKRYARFHVPRSTYEELVGMTTPAGMVDYFIRLPYAKLGRSDFGGFDAEGFEVSHIDLSWLPAYAKYLFPIRDLSARLWVDAESTLPVGIEMKIDADRGLLNGFQKVHAEFTAYDFQWDAPLPEGILDPNIPADYTQIDLGSIAQENAAWIGVGGVPVGLLSIRGWRRKHSRNARIVA